MQAFTAYPQVIQIRLERVAFEQFHDHVIKVVLYIKVVDLDNMGMPQCGYRPCFPSKSSQELSVLNKVRTQDLDRNVSVKLRMVGLINLCHATPAQWLQDTVLAEVLSFQDYGCHVNFLCM